MKSQFPPIVEAGRVLTGQMASEPGEPYGAFVVRGPLGQLVIIADSDYGWDHVSVSSEKRCPVWEEMEWVKRLLFLDGETAMQLHVPPAKHINAHPSVLHLWRPHKGKIPMPPPVMV